jgi:pseudo-rSAM protein
LLLENESQFDTLDKVLQLLAGINYNVIPIYSGSNKLFFENNVYLTEEDILELKPELKTIHTNQILNSNFFGKLFITPDGKIYENINGNCIGQINNSNLAEIVYNNILNGVYRFKTRSSCNDCKDCYYTDICPLISNYEKLFGKNNLCHIK